MNCILVPTLALDISLLDRLADSIDHPVGNKVAINNGQRGALSEFIKRHPDWRVYECGVNLGVAASWNLAPELFPEDNAWLIVNDDFVFSDGQLRQICDVSDRNLNSYPAIHFTQSEGYNCFVWTRYGVNTIGLFDENFYPAYYEDYDYRIRMRLFGAQPRTVGYIDSEITHGKDKCGGDRYNEMINRSGELNREYFIRKWGAVTDAPTNLTFKYPFNNVKNGIKFWELEKDRMVEIKKLWDKFISEPNVSIYS